MPSDYGAKEPKTETVTMNLEMLKKQLDSLADQIIHAGQILAFDGVRSNELEPEKPKYNTKADELMGIISGMVGQVDTLQGMMKEIVATAKRL